MTRVVCQLFTLLTVRLTRPRLKKHQLKHAQPDLQQCKQCPAVEE